MKSREKSHIFIPWTLPLQLPPLARSLRCPPLKALLITSIHLYVNGSSIFKTHSLFIFSDLLKSLKAKFHCALWTHTYFKHNQEKSLSVFYFHTQDTQKIAIKMTAVWIVWRLLWDQTDCWPQGLDLCPRSTVVITLTTHCVLSLLSAHKCGCPVIVADHSDDNCVVPVDDGSQMVSLCQCTNQCDRKMYASVMI